LASVEPNMSSICLGRAVRAALWAGDLANARACADRLDAHPESSALIMASRIAARGGIAALEGRLDDAVAAYRDALAQYRAIGHNFDLACAGLDCLLLVGPDEPLPREAAAEARAIFARVGARPYMERLDAGITERADRGSRAVAPESRAVAESPA